MNSLYNKEVKQFVFTRDWPKHLVFDIIEYMDPQPYLQFVFYRDNFNTFDGPDQLQIANMVNEVMMKLRNDGIPCYLEVKRNVPRQ